MTDIERINWLSAQSHISVNTIRDTIPPNLQCGDANSIAYRQGMRLQLFTIPSQHVYGTDLRHAIDCAMAKAEQAV